jgi:hypothetical protein
MEEELANLASFEGTLLATEWHINCFILHIEQSFEGVWMVGSLSNGDLVFAHDKACCLKSASISFLTAPCLSE